MSDHHQHIGNETTAILHVSGSLLPLLAASGFTSIQWLQGTALVISILAGLFAIVDSCLKIHWKVKQNREFKHRHKHIDHEGTTDKNAAK